jgi:hypothetical protein
MSQARQRAAWTQTSSVMALLANCHRDPKQRPRPYEPSDFNPLEQAPDAEPIALTASQYIALRTGSTPPTQPTTESQP